MTTRLARREKRKRNSCDAVSAMIAPCNGTHVSATFSATYVVFGKKRASCSEGTTGNESGASAYLHITPAGHAVPDSRQLRANVFYQIYQRIEIRRFDQVRIRSARVRLPYVLPQFRA